MREFYFFTQTSLLSEKQRRKFCPVGKVFDEVKVLILDDDLRQMPIGMPGEVSTEKYLPQVILLLSMKHILLTKTL